MNILKSKNLGHWVLQANQWLEQKVQKYSATSVYIPAGDTPVPLYNDWTTNRPELLKGLKLIQIDEVISDKIQVFKTFLQSSLAPYAQQIEWIKPEIETQADLAILGLGLNGHVGFHEPGIPDEFKFGPVHLNQITCQKLNLPENSMGLTYGLGSFVKCKAILMIVKGELKTEAINQLLYGKEEFPARKLISHNDFTLLLDDTCQVNVNLDQERFD